MTEDVMRRAKLLKREEPMFLANASCIIAGAGPRRMMRAGAIMIALCTLAVSVPTPALSATCTPKPRAQCTGATLDGVNFGGKDMNAAKLRAASLRGANLADIVLTRADLRKADLRDADLGNAYLDGADLTGADLRGASVFGAYLKGTKLKGARLQGVDLSYVQGISASQVLKSQAKLCKTTLPDGNVSNRNC
jgi:uncharacterized protein YjbI with pentapeptide repeats